jgi:hypothetical protein
MKVRWILASVSVLLIGSMAGAATADPAGPPPTPAAAALAAIDAPAVLLCMESSSKVALPGGNPFLPRSFVELCGSCSVAACRGAEMGTGGCSRTIPTAKCIDSDGPVCSADGLARCFCQTAPP